MLAYTNQWTCLLLHDEKEWKFFYLKEYFINSVLRSEYSNSKFFSHHNNNFCSSRHLGVNPPSTRCILIIAL